MKCPPGTVNRIKALGKTDENSGGAMKLLCSSDNCTELRDVGMCCRTAICSGGIDFDYQDKQELCGSFAEPLYEAAHACYRQKNCSAMTKCFANTACKHMDMSNECRNKLRVCSIAPGSNVSKGCNETANPWVHDVHTCEE